jgi:hypothetical protein
MESARTQAPPSDSRPTDVPLAPAGGRPTAPALARSRPTEKRLSAFYAAEVARLWLNAEIQTLASSATTIIYRLVAMWILASRLASRAVVL